MIILDITKTSSNYCLVMVHNLSHPTILGIDSPILWGLYKDSTHSPMHVRYELRFCVLVGPRGVIRIRILLKTLSKLLIIHTDKKIFSKSRSAEKFNLYLSAFSVVCLFAFQSISNGFILSFIAVNSTSCIFFCILHESLYS